MYVLPALFFALRQEWSSAMQGELLGKGPKRVSFRTAVFDPGSTGRGREAQGSVARSSSSRVVRPEVEQVLYPATGDGSSRVVQAVGGRRYLRDG